MSEHKMTPVERIHFASCVDTAQSYLRLAADEPDRAMDWLTEARVWMDRAEKACQGDLGDAFRMPETLEPKPRSRLPSRQPKPGDDS